MINPFAPVSGAGAKLTVMFVAILLFVGVIAIILALAEFLGRRKKDTIPATLFLLPAVVLIIFGLLYPALNNMWLSLHDGNGEQFVGLANYHTVFENPEQLTVLRNTAIWVLIAPAVATVIGLLYALVVDGLPGESFAKALIFLPMAISMVGASIIWKFMYDYREVEAGEQIGLINQLLVSVGREPIAWLGTPIVNTLALIMVFIWIQAGFAMTVLSASIKAIPTDINEAASLDGVSAFQRFRYVTVPSIRPALIVVLTTIAIATLKAFDIVRTMTAGADESSVIANEYYTQAFRRFESGVGAALATVLFVLVIPIVMYNIRQFRRAEAR